MAKKGAKKGAGKKKGAKKPIGKKKGGKRPPKQGIY